MKMCGNSNIVVYRMVLVVLTMGCLNNNNNNNSSNNIVNAFTLLPISQHYHKATRTTTTTTTGVSSLLLSSSPSDVNDPNTLFEDAITIPDELEIKTAKSSLLAVAQTLREQNGLFVIEKIPQMELKNAVENLERVAGTMPWKPYGYPNVLSKYQGNWTLLVTTVTNFDGLDRENIQSNLPSFVVDPLDDIRSTIINALNKYLIVQQIIKSTKNDDVIDRIDHTLELQPPKQLRDVINNLPQELQMVNINPLSVSKSKLVLIHKASIPEPYSTSSPSKTSLSLQSIVLNVAGNSQILNPNGADLLGINLPSFADELANTAQFETTFCDETVRISRGTSVLGQDQLRVFIKTEEEQMNNNNDDDDDNMVDEIVDIDPPTTTTTTTDEEIQNDNNDDDKKDDLNEDNELDSSNGEMTP